MSLLVYCFLHLPPGILGQQCLDASAIPVIPAALLGYMALSVPFSKWEVGWLKCIQHLFLLLLLSVSLSINSGHCNKTCSFKGMCRLSRLQILMISNSIWLRSNMLQQLLQQELHHQVRSSIASWIMKILLKLKGLSAVCSTPPIEHRSICLVNLHLSVYPKVVDWLTAVSKT